MYNENNGGYIWKVSIKNISLRLCSYVISKSISIHNIDHQCCVLGTFFLSNVMLYLSLSTYIWYIIISLDWWVLVIIVPAGLWSPRCVPACLPDKCAAPCLVVAGGVRGWHWRGPCPLLATAHLSPGSLLTQVTNQQAGPPVGAASSSPLPAPACQQTARPGRASILFTKYFYHSGAARNHIMKCCCREWFLSSNLSPFFYLRRCTL